MARCLLTVPFKEIAFLSHPIMLSLQKKADILRKARMEPPSPAPDADERSLGVWAREIEQRFVAYSAARAAQSLRQAEEVRQNSMLQRMAWSPGTL